jgi:hypothetical protein
VVIFAQPIPLPVHPVSNIYVYVKYFDFNSNFNPRKVVDKLKPASIF